MRATADTRFYVKPGGRAAAGDWQEVNEAAGRAQLTWSYRELVRTRVEADGMGNTEKLGYFDAQCTFMADETLATSKLFWDGTLATFGVRIDEYGSTAGNPRLEFDAIAEVPWGSTPQGRTFRVAMMGSGEADIGAV